MILERLILLSKPVKSRKHPNLPVIQESMQFRGHVGYLRAHENLPLEIVDKPGSILEFGHLSIQSGAEGARIDFLFGQHKDERQKTFQGVYPSLSLRENNMLLLYYFYLLILHPSLDGENEKQSCHSYQKSLVTFLIHDVCQHNPCPSSVQGSTRLLV
jgi:hypothetical protein